jgi:hypothetical protein
LERRVAERTKELSKINEGLKQEISVRKKAEKTLKTREIQLKTKTVKLEELNTALKVLLKQRDEDKIEHDEKVLLNINQLINILIFPDSIRFITTVGISLSSPGSTTSLIAPISWYKVVLVEVTHPNLDGTDIEVL